MASGSSGSDARRLDAALDGDTVLGMTDGQLIDRFTGGGARRPSWRSRPGPARLITEPANAGAAVRPALAKVTEGLSFGVRVRYKLTSEEGK